MIENIQIYPNHPIVAILMQFIRIEINNLEIKYIV
jgi:hypothetical protein